MFSNMSGAQQLMAFMCLCATLAVIGIAVVAVIHSNSTTKNKNETR